jgi:uncharacterized protein (TIGR02246 family)
MTPPRLEDTADHAADVAAINAVIADTETAFNTNDPDLLTAHFAADATAVAADGTRLDGARAIRDAAERLFAGPLRDQYARYTVAAIRFPHPDLALVIKHATAVTRAGDPIDVGHTMTSLYVLVRHQLRWWIVARQNTLRAT